ncbi:MAG: ATP-dependent DNA helicase [Methanomassiliicoccales archaeon]
MNNWANDLIDLAKDHVTDLFPFEQPRRSQDLFLMHARECVKHGIHLLANAPTGLGKTAVSLAAGLEHAVKNGGRVFFLVAKQSQHTAVIETAKRIHEKYAIKVVDLISRRDMCLATGPKHLGCTSNLKCYFSRKIPSDLVDSIFHSPLHVRELIRFSLCEGICPYRMAISALRKANLIVCDYNHFFGAPTENCASWLGADWDKTILVIDEAHNLPRRIVENYYCKISMTDLQRIISEKNLGKSRRKLEELKFLTSKILQESEDGYPLVGKLPIDDVLIYLANNEEIFDEIMTRRRDEFKEKCSSVLKFAHLWTQYSKDSIKYVEKRSKSLCIRLVDPSTIAAPIFSKLHCAILMSGTLHPPEMYADLLGIESRFACREYASPFPKENRLICVLPEVTSLYKKRRKSNYSKIADLIIQISGVIEGNVSCFFPSYEFLENVKSELKDITTSRRMLIEKSSYGKNEREAMISALKREHDYLMLATINGSLAEGIDFSDNILSCVIIVGFPIKPPSLETKEMKKRYEWRLGKERAHLYFDIYPAVSSVLQAAGRAIRSEKDRAVIVLMDHRYLDHEIRCAFPKDFEMGYYADPLHAIAKFYSQEKPPLNH